MDNSQVITACKPKVAVDPISHGDALEAPRENNGVTCMYVIVGCTMRFRFAFVPTTPKSKAYQSHWDHATNSHYCISEI